MARAGNGGVLFVVAEPGLGKTTILTEASSRADAEGFTVALAGCPQGAEWFPFGLLNRLLGHLGAPGVAPGENPAGSLEARVYRYAGLLEWLRHDTRRPLLLAVDDLHWADPDSVELLALAGHQLSGLGVALVATLRPWPGIALERAQLLAQEGVADLEWLEPLSDQAGAVLLEDRLGGATPTGFIERTVDSCAGNPLLLVEAAAAWRRGEDPLSGSSTIAERLLPRFAGVDANALRWARAAGILGTRFHLGLVAQLAGQTQHVATNAIEALTSAGLLRAAPGGTAEFVHPLFRQALYEDIALPVRRALHSQAFRLIIDSGGDPAEAAPHALAAEISGDRDAVDVLANAGHAALAAGAASTAVEHFEGALRLGGSAAPKELRLALTQACVTNCNLTGAETAVQSFLDSSRLSDPERVGGLRMLAEVMMFSGRYPEGKRCCEDASNLAAGFDPNLAIEVLLDASFLGWVFEGVRPARQTTGRILNMLDQTPTADPALRGTTEAADSYLGFLGGEVSDLESLTALGLARLTDAHIAGAESTRGWDVLLDYADALKFAERFDDCSQACSLWAEQAQRRGAALSYQAMTLAQGDNLWRVGRLKEAADMFAEAADLAELAPISIPFVWLGMAYLSHERGDDDQSAAWAQKLAALTAFISPFEYMELWLAFFDCRTSLRDGHVDEAVAAAERAAGIAERSGILEPCVVPWHGPALEAHLAAGQLDRASELSASLEKICAPLPCQAPRAVAAAGHAGVAWRRGDFRQAETLYQKALSHNAATPMPLAHAETLIAYGRFLRHSGRVVESRHALHQALEILAATGAVRLQRVATEELAVAGGRRRRRSSTLTPQEQRVVDLAAAGLTNGEIGRRLVISAKTVEHHLSSSYTKLSIRSRRELMTSWQRTDDPAPSEADGKRS